jgi:purine nucleosidase
MTKIPMKLRKEPCVGGLLVLAFLLLPLDADLAASGQDRPQLILDADTANEIDDMYAIARLLRQDRFDLIGLTSAQWFHALSGPRTVFASQAINEDLLRLHGRQDLPAPLGPDMEFGMPWGGEEPRDSAATRFLIDEARKTPEGEKLVVVCTGASTTLASALKLAPDIVPRIKACIMGFRYDAAKGVWNKSEFNVRRDLNAADYLLNCEGLELHIMDANVSEALKFDRDASFARQARLGDLGAYLTGKWQARFADSKTWVMWDLALVQALLHPEWAQEREVETPPENRRRKVWVYTSIDAEKMQEDFWKSMSAELPTRRCGEERRQSEFYQLVVQVLGNVCHDDMMDVLTELHHSQTDGLQMTQHPRNLLGLTLAAPFAPQPRTQPIGQKAEPDVVNHAVRATVVHRSHLQVTLQLAEGFLHVQEPFVVSQHLLPRALLRRFIGVQQIPALAPERLRIAVSIRNGSPRTFGSRS